MPIDDLKLLDLLTGVQRSIGRLEGKLDAHVMAVASHMAVTADAIARQDGKSDAQDKAIRKLEINQGKYAGAASVVGAGLGWLSYHLWPFHY